MNDGKLYYCHTTWSAEKAGIFINGPNNVLDLQNLNSNKEADKLVVLKYYLGLFGKGSLCKYCVGQSFDNNTKVLIKNYNIIIYGAGAVSSKLIKIMNEIGVSNFTLVDKKHILIEKFMGYQVFSPNILKQINTARYHLVTGYMMAFYMVVLIIMVEL
jgi:hypothetical protein